jgi:hypothetical protein
MAALSAVSLIDAETVTQNKTKLCLTGLASSSVPFGMVSESDLDVESHGLFPVWSPNDSGDVAFHVFSVFTFQG